MPSPPISSVFTVFSFLSGVFAAIGPNADLVITNAKVSPDGFSRQAVLAGSNQNSPQFPGPVITGTKGDNFNLNVVNRLNDTSMLVSTSVHWHGLFQKSSNWADGTEGITQCPIVPQQSFMYKFAVPDQAGTFWYHSHYSTQYCDGLRGALVVYDPEDPHRSLYDVDDESTIITLADWYHEPAHLTGALPVPDSTLINGAGRYPGGPAVPLTIISVQPNKRYRFRLVSMSCDPNHLFSIDGHTMTIIETDSEDVQPHVVDSIQIFPGQRYSFILTANQQVSNYWIRAQPSNGNRGFRGGINSAILRYSGAPARDPVTIQTLRNTLKESDLRPLENPGAPGVHALGKADVNENFLIEFNSTSHKFMVNKATFEPPTTPVLLQIISGAKSAQELLPKGSVYTLPANKVIELSFPGGSAGSPHPMHLHGHTFDVIRSAGSTVYNYDNPVRRDVVSIGGTNDNVTIRFTTDNAGPWLMHCHIEWHLELGLSIVFAEDVPTISSEQTPSSWNDLCPEFNKQPAQTWH
ncbi:yellow laccase [Agrocybe pediades]|nr:yellow laccase [Agrocybe pediades]